MGKVLEYPTQEDLQVIQDAVMTFLRSKNQTARETMAQTIRFILDRYGVTKISFPDFTVVASEYTAYIKAKKFVSGFTEKCPNCRGKIYGKKSKIKILSINENSDMWHDVSYGCKCGAIFRKVERL